MQRKLPPHNVVIYLSVYLRSRVVILDEEAFKKHYIKVQDEIEKAVLKAHRKPGTVQLLPVSKTFDFQWLKKGISFGMNSFGENYVQEACNKIDYFRENYPETKITWHFIGHLQSNKTRPVAERFDWVQTVDSLKIAKRLSDQRPENMAPLNLLIEVNISNQDSKSGVKPEEVRELARQIKELPNVHLRGLMAIPEPADTAEGRKKPLLAMKALFDQLNGEGFELDTLSMGMSADMVEAVECGSTMVRVGTAIFGPRDYSKKA